MALTMDDKLSIIVSRIQKSGAAMIEACDNAFPTIRKLTIQRNNSLHYGSDGEAEMVATCHSVISTVKLHGSSV